MTPFIHLHTHTAYSLLDGAARVRDLTSRAKELGMSALAMTDHGVMYGAVDFYTECQNAGIKPILGMEAYIAPRSRLDREGKMDKEYAHLVLLAKNQTGYQNLMALSSMGFTEGFYYKPRIDYAILAEYAEGLICLSACLAGDVPRHLMAGRYDEAKELCLKLKGIFGEDFYIELQDHGLPEQKHILPSLLSLCKETGIKPVATNDVHYVFEDDWEAQDALLCIQTNRQVGDMNRMRMDSNEFYLKSGDEMAERFSFIPEAISNTVKIAEQCDVALDFSSRHLPAYATPNDTPHGEYLRGLCLEGLKARGMEEHIERLDFELSVIEKMGFVDYFLIVWDFIRYAKEKGISVGPGRGSAAGSLVAYCLYITDIDPIKYGLIFERFLNPDRVTMPDVDIDFCYERRQEVIDYVFAKYGQDHVAQIITFGTMGARSVIRDVGRALGMPYGDVDRIAKLVPNELNITLERALSISAELKAAVNQTEETQKLIALALKLEGLPRHASTHAAGVVITERPVVDYVPLQKNDEAVTTQFAMGEIERLGLLKMDFLGLRTLTVVRDTEIMLEKDGIFVDYGAMDDPDVYKMISAADTDGVFQLESAGMRSFMRDLKPDSFEDIIAGISLFRPGPMDQIPTFVKCKRDPKAVRYEHPLLEPILSNTYGCMVYQEQVMQVVRDLAGYTLAESDKVRRAMSKKKADVMAKEREHFIRGCGERGVDSQTANRIFDSMTDFAQYAFNKSHAAAYAVLAYRTGYLKLHHQAQFMAALVNSVMGVSDKVAEYVGVCRQKGIPILPPDVNRSAARFSVEGNQKPVGANCVRPQDNGNDNAVGAIRNRPQQTCRDAIHRVRDTFGHPSDTDAIYGVPTETADNHGRAQFAPTESADVHGADARGRLRIAPTESASNIGSSVRFGLAGIRNVGFGAAEALVAEREANGPFETFLSFVERTGFNKRALESLVNAGACDCFGHTRAQLSAVAARAADMASGLKKRRDSGQTSFFDDEVASEIDMPDIQDDHPSRKLQLEKEATGLYISGHPLAALEKELSAFNRTTSDINATGFYALKDGARVRLGGIITGFRTKTTKSGNVMAFANLEDLRGTCELIILPQILSKYRPMLEDDALVVITGKVDQREEGPQLVVDEAAPLGGTDNKPPATLYLRIAEGKSVPKALTEALSRHPGHHPVRVVYAETNKVQQVPRELFVNASEECTTELSALIGEENVKKKG